MICVRVCVIEKQVLEERLETGNRLGTGSAVITGFETKPPSGSSEKRGSSLSRAVTCAADPWRAQWVSFSRPCPDLLRDCLLGLKKAGLPHPVD